jgi:phosphoribosylanthranilate isomerase
MNAVEIKICGITRVSDALAAVELGANMLGLNFYEASPRCISLESAQEIATAIADRVKMIGVFVNMNVSDVLRIAHAVPLQGVQLHGHESMTECGAIAKDFDVIRALKVNAEFGALSAAEFAKCNGLLLDTPCSGHGGSGQSFDWASVDWASVRRAAPTAKLFLAGGLHAGNVREVIDVVHPDAVDVCSGVESAKGIKSVDRMREFVAAVRAAERQEQ